MKKALKPTTSRTASPPKPAFPGELQWDRITAELPRFSRRQRAAFAAGCADRVLPVAIAHVGKPRPCRDAVDLTWRFAEGEAVSKKEVAALTKECQDIIDQMGDEEDDGGGASPAQEAIMCTAYALDTVTSRDCEAAEGAADCATSTAQMDDKDCDAHIEEEATWQVLALDVVRSAKVLERGMFDHLPANPRWLKVFRKRNRP